MSGSMAFASDIDDWSIDDFERMYNFFHDAERLFTSAARPTNTYCDKSTPLIEDMIDDVNPKMNLVIERLRTMRFHDAEHDDRRVRILLRYELDYPDLRVPALVKLALAQSAA